MPGPATSRQRRLWSAAVSLLFFFLALLALHRLTREFHLPGILAAAAAVPAGAIALAGLLTAGSYLALIFCDLLALRHIGHPLPYRQVALTSFLSYAIGHNAGMVMFSAGAIRYRMYSLAGLDTAEIAQVIVFCAMAFQLGAGLLTGVSLVAEAGETASSIHASPAVVATIGAAMLLAVAAWCAVSVFRSRPLTLAGWRLAVPRPTMTLAQVGVAAADLILAGLALHVMLPSDAAKSLVAFLGFYMVAMVTGAVSTVPGGLGVFESALLLLLPRVPTRELLGALLLYRVIYYAVPLAVALLMLVVVEMRRRRHLLREGAAWTRRSLDFVAPYAMSVMTFVAGAILLVSGATPAVAGRIEVLERFLPLPVLEMSHLAGSTIGVALLLLARGLYYRNAAAWHLMMWLLAGGIAASLLKGLDYEEVLVLSAILVSLLVTRREFYRPASLLAEPLAPRWLAAVAMAVGASVWIGLLAYREVPYSHELWWQFAFDASAPRMMRASLVAMLGVGVVSVLRLLQPPRARPVLPGPEDFDRVRAIVRATREVTGQLALLGDKSLLFSDSGRSFVMYGRCGRSWVSMGDPVGPPEERAEMVWRFRELCDREGGWCVFYEVRPENLPLYVDAGLSLTKLGEEGRIPLVDFSLEGPARAPLRHAFHRAEREGASFRVVQPADVPALLPALRRISDEWLAAKSAAEKGFSLGFFDERYLAECPCALVEKDGRPVAFANLWSAGCHEEISVDLMRHSQAAPKGIMDYLFVQIMLWAKAEGHAWFSLGMAPLAGLDDRRLAPAWHKLGRLVYRYGEDFYSFEGLRRYKDKFQPQWQPRYLASPAGLVLPRVLLDVTTLISGGLMRTVSGQAQQRR